MPSTPTLGRARLKIPAGFDLGSVEHLALRGDKLVALCRGGRAFVLTGAERGSLHLDTTIDLPWAPVDLALSPSGRHLLLGAQLHATVEVRDLEDGKPRMSFARGRRAYVAAGFAAHGGEEILVLSRERWKLEAVRLRDGAPVFHAPCDQPYAFVFERIVALADRDLFAAIGAHEGEGRSSMIVLSAAELAADGAAAEREIGDERRAQDYCDRIAVGSCGPDAVVQFRDPFGGEEPDESEREAAEEGDDFELFRGLCVRRIAGGEPLQLIPYAGPVATGDLLYANDEMVAVCCRDRIDVVPRIPDRALLTLPATVATLDPDCGRLARITPEGTLEFVDPPPAPASGAKPVDL